MPKFKAKFMEQLVKDLVDMDSHEYGKPDRSGMYKEAFKFPALGLVLKRTKEYWVDRGYNDLLHEIMAQETQDIPFPIAKYVAWCEYKGTFWAVQPMLDNSETLGEVDAKVFEDNSTDVDRNFNAGYDKEGNALAFDWGYEWRKDFNTIYLVDGQYIAGECASRASMSDGGYEGSNYGS